MKELTDIEADIAAASEAARELTEMLKDGAEGKETIIDAVLCYIRKNTDCALKKIDEIEKRKDVA